MPKLKDGCAALLARLEAQCQIQMIKASTPAYRPLSVGLLVFDRLQAKAVREPDCSQPKTGDHCEDP